MRFQSALFGPVGLVISSLMLGGCAAHRATHTSGLSYAGGDKTVTAENDADEEKRIGMVAHYATGLSYDLNDKPDQALDEMLKAAQLDPTYEPIVSEAARRLLRAQKTDQAIQLLNRAVSMPGSSGALYAWLGLAYAQAGKTDLAIAANRTAIKKLPQSLAPYQNLAQIYLQNSRTNEALKVLDEASQQPTDDVGFLIDLAEIYMRYGHVQGVSTQTNNQRVRTLLDRAADLGSATPLQDLRLADDYFALGDLKKAEPFYRDLVEEHPELSSLRTKLTEIYLRDGQKDKAAEQLEALAQSEPTNPQSYIFLGALAADEKKFAEAAENLERAIKLDPDLEQVYYDLAGLRLSLEQPEQALAVLEKARARFKMAFPMEFYTGITYAALKRYPEALNALTSAEAIAKATDPSRLNHLFYFQLGSTHERAGHLDEAEKYFRECLKLSPDDAETLNYLGYMWAEHGIKLDEAHKLIAKAVEIEPDNAAFLDSFAWVLYKQDKAKEALPPMLKAIEKNKKPDATLFDHLGDIYAALHQFPEARDAWTKAVKLEPNPQIQQKLDAASNKPDLSRSTP